MTTSLAVICAGNPVQRKWIELNEVTDLGRDKFRARTRSESIRRTPVVNGALLFKRQMEKMN